MFLGDVIKEYRKNNNLTLNDFAKKTGLSVSYISQLENNRNPKTNDAIVPSLGTFSKSAMAMGMSLDELLSLVDKNQPVGLTPDVSSHLTDGERQIVSSFRQLNEEGRERLLNYADDLVASGRYIKTGSADMVEEK